MWKVAAVLALGIAACTPASYGPSASPSPSVQQALAGSYALRQINGHDLPATSPTETNVEISRGWLVLEPSGSFTATLTGRRNREPTPGDETRRGTYTVAGNVLTLTGVDGPDNSVRFDFTRSGSTLTLRDDQGNSYTLQRQ